MSKTMTYGNIYVFWLLLDILYTVVYKMLELTAITKQKN